MVSGRMFPVEQRYRPYEESRDYDLNDAIADGVDHIVVGRPIWQAADPRAAALAITAEMASPQAKKPNA